MIHSSEETARKGIGDVLRRINQAWVKGNIDRLHELFHEDIVIAHPGFGRREAGRDACVASYRDFTAQAAVHEYQEEDPTIDVWGDTAVASYMFRIDYEIGGERYKESGFDLFVFLREGGNWRAVWRTLLPAPQGE
ncbi:MAG: nuclear transport factor 2 family protein [Gemmatimonadota bacterium]|nr:MAG: nuclear transport factor 2 family protein [Gemmatimonadota bacterium]